MTRRRKPSFAARCRSFASNRHVLGFVGLVGTLCVPLAANGIHPRITGTAAAMCGAYVAKMQHAARKPKCPAPSHN